MALIKRNHMDLKEKAELENTEAMTLQQKAMLDYNIMLGNLDDPTEEEGGEEDE